MTIHEIIAQINKRRFIELSKLSDADIKTVHPYVVLGWLYGHPDPVTVVMLNDMVNANIFSIPKKLSMLVMGCASSGSNDRVQWIKTKTRQDQLSTVATKLSLHLDDADTLLQTLSSTQIDQLLRECEPNE